MAEGLKIDDGTMYGLGLFETIAVENGHPVMVDNHLDRLEQGVRALEGFGAISNAEASMKIARIILQNAIVGMETEHSMGEMLKAVQEAESPDSAIDLGDEGTQPHDASDGSAPSWLASFPKTRRAIKLVVTNTNIITTRPSNVYTRDMYEQGFSLLISPAKRNDTSPLSGLVTLNFGDNIVQRRWARSRECDEAILLNTRDEVCECTTSNLFLVENGHMVTPEPDSGIIPGVLRNWVLEHREVEERSVSPDELRSCDGAFVTSSLLGIMPVSKIDGRELHSMEASRELASEYFEWLPSGDI
ncbi:MAG: aminotransferase class IV [Coriobacteriales bacterium]